MASVNNVVSNMDVSESGQIGDNRMENAGGASNINVGSNGLIKLYKTVCVKPVEMIFIKSVIYYSHGYAFKRIEETSPELLRYTTPFSYIPVDIVASYMTPSEFLNLPQCCIVKEVHCTVRILSVRTSVDVGTTLRGSANSEHLPIGMHAIGLNHVL